MTQSLFGDDEPAAQAAATMEDHLPPWLVDGLRQSLDRAGLESQRERQATVEAIVGRSVSALRDLTHREAGLVRDELHRRAQTARPGTKSAWDERGEDTWIDRL